MRVRYRHITYAAVQDMFGHLMMIESFAAHEARSIDTEDARLSERALCIGTITGLTQCGRTAHKTLPYCRLRGTEQKDVCSECLGLVRQTVRDIRMGVRVV